MRNTTRQPKMRKQLSEKSRWAYFMQAIEPKSEAINKAFADYHPQWVQLSQKVTITPEGFTFLRLALGMSTVQCAAYLRAGERTIRRWESGSIPVPFAAFELLRLILESTHFKLSHPDWDGWFISQKGVLVSPNVGRCEYTPARLEWISWQGTEATKLQTEVYRLQRALEEVQKENTKLRQMFLSQGVVDELYSLHDRMNGLIKQLATAHVVLFPATEDKQRKEKVA